MDADMRPSSCRFLKPRRQTKGVHDCGKFVLRASFHDAKAIPLSSDKMIIPRTVGITRKGQSPLPTNQHETRKGGPVSERDILKDIAYLGFFRRVACAPLRARKR